MRNSLLQIIDVAIEDKQHHIAEEAERWEDSPESTAELYKQGYATGIVGGQQDKRFTWSLDYQMGYSSGISDWVLDNPKSQIPVNLNHSEHDEF